MSANTLIKTTFSALVGLMFLAGASHAADAPRVQPPNIVFFLIDDLGRTDVGFMGCKDIHTPHIDKLAHGGTILDAHYVQPVCSPTRAALLTGRYATGTGVYTVVRPHAKWGLPLAERTLANALHDSGYETAIAGKWHLGEFDPAYVPTARGFDRQYGHYFGALDYFTHLRGGSHDWYRDGKEAKEEGYATELIASAACEMIAQRNEKKPLFLYVPFNGVHSPLQVPERYMKPYADLKGNRRTLAGMIAAVDEGIGQIVAALEKAGMRENTLIVFSSDNGGPNPRRLSTNGELRAGKGTLYEGGVRVCACANWPGHVPAGATIGEPMHAVDWYPTLVKLAGGSLEQKLPLDGRDVWATITGGAKSPHEAILLVQTPTRAAVRMGDWKLLVDTSPKSDAAPRQRPRGASGGRRNARRNFVELYDLAADVSETTNLADREPERVATMRVVLDGMLKNAARPGQLGNAADAATSD